MDEEADSLALSNVVERDKADVAIGEAVNAVGGLLEHLAGGRCSRTWAASHIVQYRLS